MKGKIVRLVDEKNFGFIKAVSGVDYFFHATGFDGHWNDLVTDINARKEILVEFDETNGVKGPRAENVRRLDGGLNI